MKTSDNGIEFIKNWEGVKLSAYQDSIGIWTIGVGHIKGVHAGMTITMDQATAFLREDLESAESDVSKLVKASLDQDQFDALVSLVFNIGGGNFAKSTLLKKVNAHDYIGASAEFAKWNKAGGRIIKGLTNRREAERKLFLGIGQ